MENTSRQIPWIFQVCVTLGRGSFITLTQKLQIGKDREWCTHINNLFQFPCYVYDNGMYVFIKWTKSIHEHCRIKVQQLQLTHDVMSPDKLWFVLKYKIIKMLILTGTQDVTWSKGGRYENTYMVINISSLQLHIIIVHPFWELLPVIAFASGHETRIVMQNVTMLLGAVAFK